MTFDVLGFVEALKPYATLEWFRFLGGRDEQGRAVPPLIVWRYDDPVQPKVDRVSSALAAQARRVDWRYEKAGRNWVLCPSRVAMEQRERGLATDTSAINWLVEIDQDFCEAALADFEQLLSDLVALESE